MPHSRHRNGRPAGGVALASMNYDNRTHQQKSPDIYRRIEPFIVICLAVIVVGLIVPPFRQFAFTFGMVVFFAVVAAVLGVVGFIGYKLARYALRGPVAMHFYRGAIAGQPQADGLRHSVAFGVSAQTGRSSHHVGNYLR